MKNILFNEKFPFQLLDLNLFLPPHPYNSADCITLDVHIPF
uniref:Uncharacterized protein n=1 Tax=Anguilla anguilla TaxID=7936 RepID=A0A0E9PRG2_ANGAN